MKSSELKVVANRLSQKALWMVDPSQELSLTLQQPIAQTLQVLLTRSKTLIEPVFILKMDSEAACDDTHRWRNEYCMAAEDAVTSWVNRLEIKNVEPPHVICHESLSTDAAVDELMAYAKRTKASLIIAQSHGQKSGGRFFIGSFTDKLLVKSHLPVLVINPESGDRTRPLREEPALTTFPTLLFPTDFSEFADEQFNQVLQIARNFHSKLILFHSVQHPIEPVPFMSLLNKDPQDPFPEYVKRKTRVAKDHAKRMESLAHENYINIETVIDERGTNVWSDILKVCQTYDADIIVMSSKLSPFAQNLQGSTTRQVVRNAPVPVLVLTLKSLKEPLLK